MLDVIDPELIKSIKAHEGFRATPYRCSADKLTLGYGTRIDGPGISEAQAECMLICTLEDCIEMLSRQSYWADLSIEQQRGLAEMMYQLGYARFGGFRLMIAALKSGHMEMAAYEALNSKWYTQTPRRARHVATCLYPGWRTAFPEYTENAPTPPPSGWRESE